MTKTEPKQGKYATLQTVMLRLRGCAVKNCRLTLHHLNVERCRKL